MTKVVKKIWTRKRFSILDTLGNYNFSHFFGNLVTLVTFEIYLAVSTARISRITVTLIWPG